ncbi:FHA domain-containing protein [Streptomyces uncialis]|uniref:FHA domain-containing protein n=1 Tax=Streptomyces uncialis TaxID=1048205 RepID=UPI0037AEFF19
MGGITARPPVASFWAHPQKGPLTAMQIRLTVLGPRPDATSRVMARDVLVTAPAGTPLAAVASDLASAVAGGDGPVVVYRGPERLDLQRRVLGEPPLIDGAVLSLGAPADPGPGPADAAAQLQVVGGPDAGGVHLLHGGRVLVGRSAEAGVPLDDPDVSRLHCEITVTEDGLVTVADLGSTNGTRLYGAAVGRAPMPLEPGALLRLGESTLRLASSRELPPPLPTTPDGEGFVRVPGHGDDPAAGPDAGEGDGVPGPAGLGPGVPRARQAGAATHPGAAVTHGAGQSYGSPGPDRADPRSYGSPAAYRAEPGRDAQAHAGVRGSAGTGAHPPHRSGDDGSHGFGHDGRGYDDGPRWADEAAGRDPYGGGHPYPDDGPSERDHEDDGPSRPGARRRGGLTAWARRLTGGRGTRPEWDPYEDDDPSADGHGHPDEDAGPDPAATPELWPDPASLLLTALGPGPRLWERDGAHREALTVRLGTTDRADPAGSGVLAGVPVTVGLREAGGLGLTGPGARLAGVARSVVAQLAALHSPDTLEIVLLSADRARPMEERVARWSWLGWLPHTRPGHGQDCRLLLAYDREQAMARTAELIRVLEERGGGAPAGGDVFGGDGAGAVRGGGTSWALGSEGEAGVFARTAAGGTGQPAPAAGNDGSLTVLIVDGDPGSAPLRDAVARLCAFGPGAGIHVVCLAETAAVPGDGGAAVAEVYEDACAASPPLRECGAVALLSGDVATEVRLVRVAAGRVAGQGTAGAVDAVSGAWAERFARALAPLRTEGGAGDRAPRVAAPLPRVARLLDELGLARATPASLMARWAAASDDARAVGGRAWTVLGAGPRGPVGVDLAHEGTHLLIEGPPGSGRTELLRAVTASLAAAERPDRLAMVLVDGRDVTGGAPPGRDGAGGLAVCTELPHVTTYLAAGDPLRMREFAQALSAELKRRAELLGLLDFTGWHSREEVPGRVVAQRGPLRGNRVSGVVRQGGEPRPSAVPGDGAGDLDTPPSSTMRLRPVRRGDPGPPLPRLVVVVDDLDALLSPPLGSTGRPAAGSVVRALEAVAREGERLGVHLVAGAASGTRVVDSEAARRAGVRVVLDAVRGGADEPGPGRGTLRGADGRVTGFQGGRVTGRIPRTATSRPRVVVVEWERMGDPPVRRSVRELGNGPTDLALLASAVERATRSISAVAVPSLL